MPQRMLEKEGQAATLTRKKKGSRHLAGPQSACPRKKAYVGSLSGQREGRQLARHARGVYSGDNALAEKEGERTRRASGSISEGWRRPRAMRLRGSAADDRAARTDLSRCLLVPRRPVNLPG